MTWHPAQTNTTSCCARPASALGKYLQGLHALCFFSSFNYLTSKISITSVFSYYLIIWSPRSPFLWPPSRGPRRVCLCGPLVAWWDPQTWSCACALDSRPWDLPQVWFSIQCVANIVIFSGLGCQASSWATLCGTGRTTSTISLSSSLASALLPQRNMVSKTLFKVVDGSTWLLDVSSVDSSRGCLNWRKQWAMAHITGHMESLTEQQSNVFWGLI